MKNTGCVKKKMTHSPSCKNSANDSWGEGVLFIWAAKGCGRTRVLLALDTLLLLLTGLGPPPK